MAKLTAGKRKALPKKINDRQHPAVVKRAPAPAPVQKGNLSPAEKARIVAKANRILGG